MTADTDLRAPHLEGGNYYDDIRIDIAESHRRLARRPRSTTHRRVSRLRNVAKLFLARLLRRLGIHEILIVNGISRAWFDQFRRYWSDVLNGRPLWNTLDFFLLLHDYRKRQQFTQQLDWGGPEQHLANWQQPSQLYATLHNVRKLALQPITPLEFWDKIRPGMRILEYGCSMAPYYYCYREFFSHLQCGWTLADIPNYPYHYAKFLYWNDPDVDFIDVKAEDFANPLGSATDYDVIVLTTVLEHLDDPLFVSGYLLNRLKPGGVFVFDYIKSEGTGLDHPRALEMRERCLRQILAATEIVHGNVDDLGESIGLCMAVKR